MDVSDIKKLVDSSGRLSYEFMHKFLDQIDSLGTDVVNFELIPQKSRNKNYVRGKFNLSDCISRYDVGLIWNELYRSDESVYILANHINEGSELLLLYRFSKAGA